MRTGQPQRAVLLLTLVALVSACAGGNSAASREPPLTTIAAIADREASSTTATATTSTTSSTSSTTSSTTTTIALPAPEPAPLDERGDEPYVELGTIEIPAIDLGMTLFEGVRLTTLDHGPGHWPGTAMPGHLGNVVVAGHRTSKDRPFRHLDRLAPGDEVVFTTVDGRFVYLVASTEIVAPDAEWIVEQTPEHTATLFACHPPGSTRERIVVHLTLAPDATPAT